MIKWRKVNCTTCVHTAGSRRCFSLLNRRIFPKVPCAKIVASLRNWEEKISDYELIPWGKGK